MHFSADHPKLLSQNGRLLWQFHQKQASNDPGQEAPPSPSDGPLVLRCLNLLTGWTADYALVGFASPIGVPLALYWLDGGEDMLVMLDWQGQQGQHISQRKLKLDHWRREARWIGPVHRQYVTDIAKVDNVVVGEEAVVLVGHDPQWSWRTPSQLVLPLSPDNGKAGEELCLAGMTPLADVSSGTAENGTAIRAFFFLGRPAATENGGDEIEPREMAQKLFFLCGRPPLGGKGLFACPSVKNLKIKPCSRRPAPLSLTDSILLSIQCSSSSHQLKSDCLQLLGQLRRFDFH